MSANGREPGRPFFRKTEPPSVPGWGISLPVSPRPSADKRRLIAVVEFVSGKPRTRLDPLQFLSREAGWG